MPRFFVIIDLDQQPHAGPTLDAAIAALMPASLGDVLHACLVEADDQLSAVRGKCTRIATVNPEYLNKAVVEYLVESDQ